MTVFALVVSYPLIGLCVGVLQNAWVSFRSGNESDSFFTARCGRKVFNSAIVWPFMLYAQFLIKVLHYPAARVGGMTGGDAGQPRRAQMTKEARKIKIGDNIRFTLGSGSLGYRGKMEPRVGIVLRKYDMYNCQYLSADGRYILLPNRTASAQLESVEHLGKIVK